MKSALRWLLIVAFVVGGGVFGLYTYQSTVKEHTYRTQLDEVKKAFLAQLPGLQHLGEDDYRREVGIALTRYFREVAALAKEYPEQQDLERERTFGEAELSRGRMTEAQKMARDERIDLALDLFERMRNGQYRPIYTASDHGFRFDIYDISPAKVSGENRVKVSFVHWGAFGPLTYESILGNMRAKQEEGKPVEIPQIVADNAPPNLTFDPQRWVMEFFPGVEIGYYDLPQFPRQAEAVELSFGFSMRTAGGTAINSNISFPEIPIPESWRVPEGQKWEAQERFADDEELQAAGATPSDG